MNIKLVAALVPLSLFVPKSSIATDSETVHAAEPTAVHCQVPCGIYGDMMRIDMIAEDAATIAKGMAQVREMEAAGKPNYNQIVRWITTKDDHAQHIQDMAGDYWFAQRIKAPAADADEAARAKYLGQLQHMHGIMTSAMKCKQTTDDLNVSALKRHTESFSSLYFSKEDLEHIKQRHGSEHDEHK